jgi:hypothetical protein
MPLYGASQNNQPTPKSFDVDIDGHSTRMWTIFARSYADVTSQMLCDPERFDLNNAKLDGIVRITNLITLKTYYYRLRHNGQFFLDRVADAVGMRDSTNITM